MKSEFGKGFLYPLTLFALHFERDGEAIFGDKKPKEYELEIWKTKDVTISRHIEIFFNGASDHLYEMEVPSEFEGNEIGELALKLKQKALEIGHGFSGRMWTKDDFIECYDLLKRIMFLLDKMLGVNPVKADFD